MKTKTKRILSIVCALVMCVTLLPTSISALAAPAEGETPASTEAIVEEGTTAETEEETSEPASAEESEPESTTAAESAADDVTKPAEETEPVTEAPQESSEAVEETTEGIDVPTSAANDILDDEGADSQEVTTGTITENMSQAEVDAVVAENDVIVVEAGSYGIEDEKNHIKLTLTKGSQTVKLAGDYTRLMVVVLSEGNRIEADNAVINGEVDTVYNQSPAIYVPYGSVTVAGQLTLTNHDYGVILGHTESKDAESAQLTLDQGAVLNITGCKTIKDVGGDSSYDNGIICAGTDYFSHVDSQGDGTRGSAITTKGKGNIVTKVTVSENAQLICEENSGAGIFSVNVELFELNINPAAMCR